MDGQTYLKHFSTNEYDSTDASLEALASGGESELTNKIHLLYGLGEIHFIGDEPDPQVVLNARSSIAAGRQDAQNFLVLRGYLFDQNLLRQGKAVMTDRPKIDSPSVDLSSSMSRPELEQHVDESDKKTKQRLATYSDDLLSLAIARVHSICRKGNMSPDKVAEAVIWSIGSSRHALRSLLDSERGVITVERDYEPSRASSTGAEVDCRVSLTPSGQNRVPAWLPTTNDWRYEVHKLCSTITLEETFLALKEWVTARRLPLVPVIAPFAFKREAQRADGKRLCADILLCNITPGSNEIIPFQVKNRVTASTREDYDPGVVLVKAENITQATIEPVMVWTPAGNKTGHKTTMQYGKLRELYFANRSGNNRIRPSNTQRQALKEALETPFHHFDLEIPRRMKDKPAHL